MRLVMWRLMWRLMWRSHRREARWRGGGYGLGGEGQRRGRDMGQLHLEVAQVAVQLASVVVEVFQVTRHPAPNDMFQFGRHRRHQTTRRLRRPRKNRDAHLG